MQKIQDVFFSSTEHGCEFERRVGDGEQFGKPLGQGIRVSFFLGYFIFWTSKKRSASPYRAKPKLKKNKKSIGSVSIDSLFFLRFDFTRYSPVPRLRRHTAVQIVCPDDLSPFSGEALLFCLSKK